MERIFRRKNNIQSKSTVAAKTGFPPFARRSLPSGNSGVPIRAASPVVRGSAHEKKTGFAQAKAAACEACKHPGCKPGRARKRTRKLYQNYPNFQKKLQKSGQKCSKNCICSENCPKSACQKMKNRKFAVFTVYFFSKNSFSD